MSQRQAAFFKVQIPYLDTCRTPVYLHTQLALDSRGLAGKELIPPSVEGPREWRYLFWVLDGLEEYIAIPTTLPVCRTTRTGT